MKKRTHTKIKWWKIEFYDGTWFYEFTFGKHTLLVRHTKQRFGSRVKRFGYIKG